MREQTGVLPQPAPTMNNEITTALCVCVCVSASACVCSSRCKLPQLKQTCLWIPECQACSHAYHVCAREAGLWLYVPVTSKGWVRTGVSDCVFTHTHTHTAICLICMMCNVANIMCTCPLCVCALFPHWLYNLPVFIYARWSVCVCVSVCALVPLSELGVY